MNPCAGGRLNGGSSRKVVGAEPGVEELGGVVFVAGEEVAVAVKGDGDAGVAHVGAEGFGVDAGGDGVAGVGVAAVVEGDRFEVVLRPGFAGASVDGDG